MNMQKIFSKPLVDQGPLDVATDTVKQGKKNNFQVCIISQTS